MMEAEAAGVAGDGLGVAATSFGLRRVLLAAALVPTWGYLAFALSLFVFAVYNALDFHIVGDILSGWKGHKTGLYYGPQSPVAAMLLSKCEVLKQRYWPTPWLCSPHLQTLFLHFFGRSPQVDYQRQLFVTADGGTIALDWVKDPALKDEKSGNSAALDDTPTAIIIPGLTSDCTSHYVRHIAGCLSQMRWRVLVANHRGLGGVSITSDQFYNAGWTEDLRKIVLLVQQTNPRSPLLAVGLSIGANILVKYLGEEGASVPLSGAVAIGCPWDLLVCDRFMSRGRVQSLYNKALALGLQQYAQLHQTALARMIDWNLLQKSASIRDFDDYCTRHVGKFATVDTYYRTCSSVQFLETISIPLLCISAEDDPICTKEAIPYDECRVNPNIILGVSRHGGHLAFYEGFDATSLWWVRATAEFFGVLLSSSHLEKQSKIAIVPSKGLGSNIDKGPFLTVGDGLAVPTGDPGCHQDSLAGARNTGGELSGLNTEDEQETRVLVEDGFHMQGDSMDDLNDSADSYCKGPLNRSVIREHRADTGTAICAEQAPEILNHSASPSSDLAVECLPPVTIKFRDAAEMAALQSALTQILHQVPLPSSLNGERKNLGSNSQLDSGNATFNQLQAQESPAAVTVVENCTDVVKQSFLKEVGQGKVGVVFADEQSQKPSLRYKEEEGVGQWIFRKDLACVATQNRRTLWLLTYVAVMTTFPFLRTAFLVRTKGRLLDILSRQWKRIP